MKDTFNTDEQEVLPVELLENRILEGDCLYWLKRFPPNIIDLAIASPPYGLLRDYLSEYQNNGFNFEGTAPEVFRVLKPGGVLVWIVNDSVLVPGMGKSARPEREILYFVEDVGFNYHDRMICEKNGSSFPSIKHKRFGQVSELMIIFTKGKIKCFNPIKDHTIKYRDSYGRSTKRQRDNTLKEYKWKISTNEMGLRTNIWRYETGGLGKSSKDLSAHDHPAIFAEKMAADHIKAWSNRGDIVLDFLSGSGTTCCQAKKYGRRYIGIEISTKYAADSRKRIDGTAIVENDDDE
ncbi:MAG: site-specific DNA-methyltransferase [Nitrospirae bacterium]|nr:site-specific DNA-methyltransferase [Nitrospirota bacterium]